MLLGIVPSNAAFQICKYRSRHDSLIDTGTISPPIDFCPQVDHAHLAKAHLDYFGGHTQSREGLNQCHDGGLRPDVQVRLQNE